MAVSENAIEIYTQILQGIGAPVTEENLKFLVAWQQAEGGRAMNNPFNTTYNLDADADKTNFNSVGVKNYTSPEYGVIATIKTLKLPYYKNIVKGLRENSGANEIASLTNELNTWGTGDSVRKVLNKGVTVNTSSSKKAAAQRALTNWAYTQEKNWSGIKELDDKGVEMLKEYNKRMGVNYNPNDAWSAITISNAVMADAGARTKDEMRALGFNPSKSHSSYISDAFKAAANPDYKYNRYVAEKLDGEYKVGDILIKGRKDGKSVGTSKWSYEDFASKDKGYPSHGDIIIDKGQDSKGKYVILAGGNLSNTYKNNKLYLSDIGKKKYKVKLNDTKKGVFISEDGNLIDEPEFNDKVESVNGATGTPLDKAPITNEDNIVNKDETETESLETGVDEVDETPQVGYSSSSGDAFRLSDSAQMSLFGTIIYPRGGSRSGVPSNDTFYQDLQNTNEEDSEFATPDVTPEPESKKGTAIPVDSDTGVEDIEDPKSNKTNTAWWKDTEKEENPTDENPTDEELSQNSKNTNKEANKKLDGKETYKKDPYISYLDGDITKEEYQKYLRTQPEFKKDFDKVENTLSGYREKFGKAVKNSVGGTSYILTSDQIKKQRKIAKDFADKYGYSTEGWITDKEFVKDEARDMLNDGLFKSKGLRQDVKKYNEEYADYNRLKAGFSKAGWDIDDKGNISFNGEKPVSTIQNIIKEEKDNFSKFDFNANDGKGGFVVEKGKETDLALKDKNQECSKKDMYYVKELGRCGTWEEFNFHAPCPSFGMTKNEKGDCQCPPGTTYYSGMGCLGPQGAGSADDFWAGTLLGPASVLGTIGTYIGDAVAEIVLPPVYNTAVDLAFDAYNMQLGNPIEKAQVYEKYAQPIRDANARYDKADGFLNGINAFFGGDPNYNTGSWYNFDKGGSIELDLNKKEVLKYAQNGYIVEEVGYDDPVVKQRRGSRKNYDNKTWTPSGLQFPTSESSHLMMAEYDDNIDPSTGEPVGWVGFPSLFQDDKPYANDQDNWVQMSGDNGWGSIYEEAKRRGEVYYFGEDKEAALAFGEGSWKDQLPDEDMEVELTDEEVEQYRAGGYVLEELKDGGETYTVKSGDTFYGIANKFNVKWPDLEKANPGVNIESLKLGQVLSIPKKQVAKKSGVTSAVKKSIQSMPSAIDLEGVSYNSPLSYYTYNNNQYAKRGADWFKMINDNYKPLTAGNVPERYKVLNKYAKPVKNVSKPKINQEPIKINESNILNHLKKREGEKNYTYEDSRGYLTGGVGHKLTEDEIKKYPLDKAIPESQINKWLAQDSRKAIEAAKKQAKELKISDPKFIEALTSVNFQLGTAWNTKHKKTWALMKEGAYDKAADEAADSLWYKQTPVRVKDLQKALKELNTPKEEDGGFILDLTKDQVKMYTEGGYIVEEIK